MAEITEGARRVLHDRAAQVLGDEPADILMTLLPTSDVATKDFMRAEIGGLRTEMHQEIGGLRTEMHQEIGGLHKHIGRQTWVYVGSTATMFVGVGGLAFAAAHLVG